MIISVVRSHHWMPFDIENLYLDDTDFLGLEFWYNDVKIVTRSLREDKT